MGNALEIRVYPRAGGVGGWVVLTAGEVDVVVATDSSAGEPPGEAVGAEVLVVPGSAPDSLAGGYVVGTGEGGAGLTLPAGGQLTFWADGRTVWPGGQ